MEFKEIENLRRETYPNVFKHRIDNWLWELRNTVDSISIYNNKTKMEITTGLWIEKLFKTIEIHVEEVQPKENTRREVKTNFTQADDSKTT